MCRNRNTYVMQDNIIGMDNVKGNCPCKFFLTKLFLKLLIYDFGKGLYSTKTINFVCIIVGDGLCFAP